MPHVERDGVRIFYESHGSGPVLFLAHGYAATTHMWRGQVEAFSGRYRVITWDMRGHGESDSPAEPDQYSRDATCDDMAAILDACGVERAVVGGLSLGGHMALAFALRHPSRVRALALFDAGPGYRNPGARANWNETAATRAAKFEERGLRALGRGAEVLGANHRSAEGLAMAARGILAQPDTSVIDAISTLTMPALVLVGENDHGFRAGADYMATRMPAAHQVILPGAGHASNLDQPEAFNAALEAFLASLP